MRRWEELRPELETRGIELVAISTDTPEEIRAGRGKHGTDAVLLSDPELAVTDLFNLRNPKNITPRGISGMPIPTTILTDSDGIVRWIDQTDDYMLRSDPDRVLEAIRTTFG